MNDEDDRIGELEAALADTESDLAAANERVQELESEKGDLESENEKLRSAIDDIRDTANRAL